MPEARPDARFNPDEQREVLQQLLHGRTVDSIAAHHNAPVDAVQPLKDQLRNAFGPHILPDPRTKADDPPVTKGDVLRDVRMVTEGDKGDGTTFVDGYTVIVPGTRKGDVVDIRIVTVEDTFGFGEVLDEDG